MGIQPCIELLRLLILSIYVLKKGFVQSISLIKIIFQVMRRKHKDSSLKKPMLISEMSCRTPLHLAAMKGHKNVAELLIRKVANVNIRDDSNQTPLQQAVHSRHNDVARLYIGKGKKVNN
ncbi:ankyrin repeat domain-containing protein 7-like [Sitodiplosis mosellana]|uniref:ankyrin repeat domain-containing protein 7-like n=1 Tax=Sitodiplosis mosellana TaxID=263140 RepID=UPI00244508F7|nr:ankyrin repeat domain-containing protein 7-like [Sitodiplosis mosellana]